MPSWTEVLAELQRYQRKAAEGLDLVRRKYLKQLHKHTGRNVIAYYSGFLTKPNIYQADINNEDMNGFMVAVNKLDRSKGLDLMLHTPGGDIYATQSIVHYLRTMFDSNIRAIVPQIAMSAGTMIACACCEIILTKHSQLGPTDPHLNGIPAAGVKQEFDRACQEVADDPHKIPIWQSIIGQYHPTFLSRCENAVQLSKEFVTQQLAEVMFKDEEHRVAKASDIVDKLNDFSGNKSHNRPIHAEECIEMGPRVARLEDDDKAQDLVLTVHHCYMHAFMNGVAFKIIENHNGEALAKFEPQNKQSS